MPSVAIIGASADRGKFGNKAVRAYLQRGYQVYPVHPTAKEIEGLTVYGSLGALPAEYLDLVSIYLPPRLTLQILPEIASRRIGEVIFNPGSHDDEVLQRARELQLPMSVGCSIVAAGFEPADF